MDSHCHRNFQNKGGNFCFQVRAEVTDKNSWCPGGSQRWIGFSPQPLWFWLSDVRAEPIGEFQWSPPTLNGWKWIKSWQELKSEWACLWLTCIIYSFWIHTDGQPWEWNLSLWASLWGRLFSHQSDMLYIYIYIRAITRTCKERTC